MISLFQGRYQITKKGKRDTRKIRLLFGLWGFGIDCADAKQMGLAAAAAAWDTTTTKVSERSPLCSFARSTDCNRAVPAPPGSSSLVREVDRLSSQDHVALIPARSKRSRNQVRIYKQRDRYDMQTCRVSQGSQNMFLTHR